MKIGRYKEMDIYSYLIVENGHPYESGQKIEIPPGDTLLGRSSKTNQPDIPFSSLYVSRKHALVNSNEGRCFLSDLGSTHGTQINGSDLEPNVPYFLNDSDRITFVKGMVSLIFKQEIDMEKTMTLPLLHPIEKCSLYIDVPKKQVWLNNELLTISGKARDLLFLLYENKNHTVSYEEIKMQLWKERQIPNQEIPDVTNDEMSSLVYRLRKHLGNYGDCIVTVARYGLLLNLPERNE